MKRILFMLMLFCTLCTSITAKSIWENHYVGIGYSYTNVDGYKDNNIDVQFMAYGVYVDGCFGTSLKDSYYDPHNTAHKTSFTVDLGYNFPILVADHFKILAGPILGYTRVGWNETNGVYYEGYDYYGYYEGYDTYNTFVPCDEYFNYGAVMHLNIYNVGINCKVSRTNIGIGIGYSF